MRRVAQALDVFGDQWDDVAFDGTLQEFLDAVLEKADQIGGDVRVKLERECGYYDDPDTFKFEVYRLETNEEQRERKRREADEAERKRLAALAAQEAQERALFEKLKRKFDAKP